MSCCGFGSGHSRPVLLSSASSSVSLKKNEDGREGRQKVRGDTAIVGEDVGGGGHIDITVKDLHNLPLKLRRIRGKVVVGYKIIST